MKCARCGAAMKAGDIFCTVCGDKADETGSPDDPPVSPCTLCGGQIPREAAFCLYCGAPRRFSANFYPALFAPKRGLTYGTASRPHRLRIAAAVIAAVLFVGAILLSAVLERKAAPVVYCKQDALLTADLDTMKISGLARGLSYSEDAFKLDFYTFCSPDGRYLYYPEPDGDSATVCRRDLTADPGDPHATVKIDSGIGYPFEVTPEGREVYLTQPGGSLYVNDGNSRQRIALGVSYFELSADGSKLVYTGLNGDIRFMDMRRLSEEKIVSNATMFLVSDDFSTVYYDRNGGLYAHKISGGKHKIATDISGFIARMDDGTVYYTKPQTLTVRLADILNDDMKDKDAALFAPDIADYQTQQPAAVDSGTLYEVVTDEEAYNAALNAYAQKLRRDEIRAQADTFSVDFCLDTLYAYKDGKETAVTGDFAYSLAASGDGLLVYKKTVLTVPEMINISEIRDIDALDVLFGGFLSESGNVYAARGGAETRLVEVEAPSLAIDNSFVYARENDRLYYLDGFDSAKACGTLKFFTVTGGGFSAPQTVDTDVCTFALDTRTNAVFYMKAMQNGSGILYRDGVKIDSGVSTSGLLLSDNGHTLYYLRDLGQHGGTLMRYTGGSKKRIAGGVSEALLVDGRLVYLADFLDQRGDLYLYTGGESRLIDDGVSGLIDTQKYRQPPGLTFLSPGLLDTE